MNKNTACFCLVSVALLVIVGVAVANPMVASQFDCYVQMQVTGNGQSVSYSGSMYYDLPTLRKREVLQVNGQNIDVLSRYDLQKQFQISGMHCAVNGLSRSESDMFGWLRFAQYGGQMTVNGYLCDMYNYMVPNAQLSSCLVNNVPLYLRVSNNQIDIQYYFGNFFARRQPDSVFQIPASCPRYRSFDETEIVEEQQQQFGDAEEMMDSYDFAATDDHFPFNIVAEEQQ